MRFACTVFLLWALLCLPASATPEVWLETLDLRGFVQARGEAQAHRSLEGKPLTIGGKTFAHGVGTNADSEVTIRMGGRARRFEAWVGVDDAVKPWGRVVFRVFADGAERWNSGLMRGGDEARHVEIDLREVGEMTLRVDNSGAEIFRDQVDWAMARIEMAPGAAAPKTVVLSPAKAVRRTPRASPKPRLCGPTITAARPRVPFLFALRATGTPPMRYSAQGLPPGLSLDPSSGIISGVVAQAGTWDVRVRAASTLGADARVLRVVIGKDIALTPVLGWNSWNVWGADVNDARVRAAADMLVSSGLAAHGWTYINIDDGWAKGRDAAGHIVPNEKFPDMKALGDYIHARGLKFGIYSSPGPRTCAGFQGSEGHEADDARTFAAWGVDYLKYDWCSCTSSDSRTPFAVMHDALAATGRDIVYSICQYGRDEVWTWGARFGTSWRTTGDIDDVWGSVLGIGFGQNGLQPYASPGRYNDPDMLVVGWLGWGPKVRPTRLDPNEQYTHVTLWSLLAAPLIVGCDLTRLDDFTLGLLSNDEVLAIDQDTAVRQGWKLYGDDVTQVWGRPLADGSWAIGLFNLGRTPRTLRFEPRRVALLGPVKARDVWRQRDLGTFDRVPLRMTVAPHGAELLRLIAVRASHDARPSGRHSPPPREGQHVEGASVIAGRSTPGLRSSLTR